LSPDHCKCKTGYSGENCQNIICYGKESNDKNVCSSNGVCEGPNNCKCKQNFININFTNSQCTCKNGYFGANCENYSCFSGLNQTNFCSSNGKCVDHNKCECYFGYTKEDCSEHNIYLILIPTILILVMITILIIFIGIIFDCVKKKKYIDYFQKIKQLDINLDEEKFLSYLSEEEVQLKNNLNIDFKELDIESKIDEGGSSIVFKGKWLNNVVAIKLLKNSNLFEQSTSKLLGEVKILSQLHHPNIICLYGISIHQFHTYIITEYVECQNLYQLLNDSNLKIDFNEKINILICISEGIFIF
jgi:hypothetical protein